MGGKDARKQRPPDEEIRRALWRVAARVPWPAVLAVCLYLPGIVLWAVYSLRCKASTFVFLTTIASVSQETVDGVTNTVNTTLITLAAGGTFIFALLLVLAIARSVQRSGLAPDAACPCARPSPSSLYLYRVFNLGFNIIVFFVNMAIILLMMGAFLWLVVAYAANVSIKFGVRDAAENGVDPVSEFQLANHNYTTVVSSYERQLAAAPPCVSNGTWLRGINASIRGILAPPPNATDGANTFLCPQSCLNLGSFATLFKLSQNCICNAAALYALQQHSLTVSTEAGAALGGSILIYLACCCLHAYLISQHVHAGYDYRAAKQQYAAMLKQRRRRAGGADGGGGGAQGPGDGGGGGGGGGGSSGGAVDAAWETGGGDLEAGLGGVERSLSRSRSRSANGAAGRLSGDGGPPFEAGGAAGGGAPAAAAAAVAWHGSARSGHSPLGRHSHQSSGGSGAAAPGPGGAPQHGRQRSTSASGSSSGGGGARAPAAWAGPSAAELALLARASPQLGVPARLSSFGSVEEHRQHIDQRAYHPSGSATLGAPGRHGGARAGSEGRSSAGSIRELLSGAVPLEPHGGQHLSHGGGGAAAPGRPGGGLHKASSSGGSFESMIYHSPRTSDAGAAGGSSPGGAALAGAAVAAGVLDLSPAGLGRLAAAAPAGWGGGGGGGGSGGGAGRPAAGGGAPAAILESSGELPGPLAAPDGAAAGDTVRSAASGASDGSWTGSGRRRSHRRGQAFDFSRVPANFLTVECLEEQQARSAGASRPCSPPAGAAGGDGGAAPPQWPDAPQQPSAAAAAGAGRDEAGPAGLAARRHVAPPALLQLPGQARSVEPSPASPGGEPARLPFASPLLPPPEQQQLLLQQQQQQLALLLQQEEDAQSHRWQPHAGAPHHHRQWSTPSAGGSSLGAASAAGSGGAGAYGPPPQYGGHHHQHAHSAAAAAPSSSYGANAYGHAAGYGGPAPLAPYLPLGGGGGGGGGGASPVSGASLFVTPTGSPAHGGGGGTPLGTPRPGGLVGLMPGGLGLGGLGGLGLGGGPGVQPLGGAGPSAGAGLGAPPPSPGGLGMVGLPPAPLQGIPEAAASYGDAGAGGGAEGPSQPQAYGVPDVAAGSPLERRRSGYRSSMRKGLLAYDQYKHRQRYQEQVTAPLDPRTELSRRYRNRVPAIASCTRHPLAMAPSSSVDGLAHQLRQLDMEQLKDGASQVAAESIKLAADITATADSAIHSAKRTARVGLNMDDYDPNRGCPAVLKLYGHVLEKGWQAGSLLGVVGGAPALAFLTQRRGEDPLADPAGLLLRAAAYTAAGATALSGVAGLAKFLTLTREGFEDRAYRLHYNQSLQRNDRFAHGGMLLGVAAAAYLYGTKPSAERGVHLAGGAALGTAAGVVAHLLTRPAAYRTPNTMFAELRFSS
ncbi:hypothetical protein HT031_002608 [Scenedesmus sp. PABB004]|nr:hypothetical protein HT031_002608 [Scenedesmus sp. PABB004]